MCTAISLLTTPGRGLFFGRTLDNDFAYGAAVTVTPRRYPLRFRHTELPEALSHYAYLGVAAMMDGVPLYFDGMNEKGLCMAGLNFPESAVYFPPKSGKLNLAQWEFLPCLMGTCATVAEARERLLNINLTDDSFREGLPPATLHWILSDSCEAVVIEQTSAGLAVYDNPMGVLANEPPFPTHRQNLRRYMHLSPRPAENCFAPTLSLSPESLGSGALGLPGDFTSTSRFVRAAFMRANSVSGTTEGEGVSQFFRLMDTVSLPRGANLRPDGKWEITIYTDCYSGETGTLYYSTYENRNVNGVRLFDTKLNGCEPIVYPMKTEFLA